MDKPKPQDIPLRQRLLRRKGALWAERASWLGDWQDLVEYVAPMAGRFYASDSNKGNKVQRSKRVYDNTAKGAQTTLAAGLMAGMTSPARPWFRLATSDNKLMDNHEVKKWLKDVEEKMREVFAESNTYRALHQLYGELGAFATGCAILVPDFKNVIHIHTLTIGEYALATDPQGMVNTLVRELRMTVGQMVEQFGYDACSEQVKNLYNNNNLDSWQIINHTICPREDRDVTKKDGKNKKFMSVYYEASSVNNTDKGGVLSESGFDSFPALCPRWLVTGADVYGTGPGHDALPDIRQLQHGQLRRAQAIDYQVQPPLQVPATLKAAGVNRLPGGVQYVDSVGSENSIKTMFDVRLDLSALREDIGDMRDRIKQHYFEHLFMMMANDTRSGITATEVAERHEEKLLMLGPVLERLQNELLDPLIDFTFERLIEAGVLPAPPKALGGLKLGVQYISSLAQAQRAVGLQSIDRLITTVGTIAQAKQDPSAWDKIDIDQVIDQYGDGLGVSPRIVLASEQAQAARDARAKQMQQAQAMQQAETAAKTMQSASNINPQNVQDVMGMFSGYGSPTPVEAGM
jgi:hypothetical protein